MFKTQNFCHVASNNRNNVKAGVFIYKTNDNLQTVSASGYFNARIIDINLHDLIIHEYIDPTDNTKVLRNVLCVTVKTLDNIETVVIKSNWQGDIEQEIADLRTYVDNTFVKKDGSSIMSGPLKFIAGSYSGAIAGGLGDGIEIYKINSSGVIQSEVASLTLTNGFIPGTTNTISVGSSALKWKNLYLSGKAYVATINNGADISVPTTSGTMALTSDIAIKSTEAQITSPINNQVLKYDGSKWVNATVQDLDNVITNCPIEIPQDINIQSPSNNLVLKSGSKVYVPNGSGVYTPIQMSADVSRSDFSAFGSGTYMVFYSQSYGGLIAMGTNRCVSGSTDPSTDSSHVWYDTTENKIKVYESGSYTRTDLSLPICIMTNTYGTGVTSIDQVFNGVGFIGSVIYALPGVKGLHPAGRNADGTLKNTTATVSSVITHTSSYWYGNVNLYIASNGLFVSNSVTYDADNNTLSAVNVFYAGKINLNSSFRVLSINPSPAFHAVDYYDFIDKDSQNAKKAENNTFSGTNTFTGLTRSESNSPKFEYKNTGMNIATSGGTSLGDTYIADARDTNNEQSGYIYNRMLNGTVSLKMGATSKTTGSSKGAEIAPTVENSGKRYIQATTPTKSDNTMDLSSNTNTIATTEWVKSYAMGLPDWSNPTQITANSTWVATANGYVCGGQDAGSGSAGGWIKINNNFYSFHVYFQHTGSAVGTVPVAKGDAVTVEGGTYYFIPCKNL